MHSPPQNGPGSAEFHRGGRWIWHPVRSISLFALLAAAASATVLSFARAFCLQPYWPAGPGLWCHPDHGLGVLLGRAALETLRTTLFIAIPGLAVGAGVHVVVWICARALAGTPLRIAGGVAGAAAWTWLLVRLEPSYLDSKVAPDAMIAGGIVAALVASLVMPDQEGRRGAKKADRSRELR